jgi:hypothetical protein
MKSSASALETLLAAAAARFSSLLIGNFPSDGTSRYFHYKLDQCKEKAAN